MLFTCSLALGAPVILITGQTMGTYYRISLASDDDIDIKALRDEIEFELESLNSIFSTYLSDSEISKFNKSTSVDYQAISSDMRIVVSAALELFDQTQGYFDITLEPLVKLWSFGSTERLKVPPSAQIKYTQAMTGADKLTIKPGRLMLKKSSEQLQMDLNAIAKGYAVDQIYDLLKRNEYPYFLVDIGGELRASEEKHKGASWRVGIEKADSHTSRSVQQIVILKDKSIATSGSYRNYFEQDGARYSHIINPVSGYPITHKLVSVSVVSDSCMLADGYATALMVLGPDKGYDFALQYDLAVYMIVKQSEGFTVKITPGMQTYLVNE